ncbi:hypothetical protein EDB83DRAFT_2516815 [Lactarius deliciosus]|nr:hypothetical protein EDB83DRAFT_2516815 [Lactarius deliciosus]
MDIALADKRSLSVAVVQVRIVHHATFVAGSWGRPATPIGGRNGRDEPIGFLPQRFDRGESYKEGLIPSRCTILYTPHRASAPNRLARSLESCFQDSDDEMDEPVSLTHTVFDADIPDNSEGDADISVSTTTCVPSFATSSFIDLDYTPSSPSSSYASSICDDKGALAAQASPPSDKNCVQRRVKSFMRHKAYSVPSRGQREAFKRNSRSKKVMFVEDPFNPFPSDGPPTLSPAFDPLLSTSGTSDPSILAHQVELYLPALLEDKCSMEETRSQSAQAGSVSTPHVRTAKKSGLTIKIPSLVDRLALRLVHSCNVAEQAEEEDLYYSPDGCTASESSFDSEQDYILRSSSPSSSPDRLSRRSLRRRAVAPYHRMEKSKRKELWLNSEVVPAVLLSPFSSERHTRSLRSGHRY